ncbi:unnamed protein product [Pleuronectes platessa]|uniref:Uncharacterized protein n=1 Tax=Pleuronectes platessa TaxID=8262 RepID=A0A9N7TKC1_PLEPL|nr:unnamed protein product [Pleuronectes platessa]
MIDRHLHAQKESLLEGPREDTETGRLSRPRGAAPIGCREVVKGKVAERRKGRLMKMEAVGPQRISGVAGSLLSSHDTGEYRVQNKVLSSSGSLQSKLSARERRSERGQYETLRQFSAEDPPAEYVPLSETKN